MDDFDRQLADAAFAANHRPAHGRMREAEPKGDNAMVYVGAFIGAFVATLVLQGLLFAGILRVIRKALEGLP